MKNILKFLIIAVVLAPNFVFAAGNYQSTNLEETFKQEALLKDQDGNTVFEYDLSGYTENDKQITIYLFRGNGCGFCNKFLKFLNSIIPEYGKYFKLESYEVWSNQKNSELLEEIGEFLDEDVRGVPFIIIGDQVFPGYAEHMDDQIKAAIVNLYNSDDRYDIIEEINKPVEEKPVKVKYAPIVIWNAVVTTLITAAGIGYVYTTHNDLYKKLDAMSKELKEIKKNTEEKEELKQEPAKKVKTAATKAKKTTKKTTKKTDEK